MKQMAQHTGIKPILAYIHCSYTLKALVYLIENLGLE